MLTFVANALAGKALKGLIAIWTKDQAYLSLAADTAMAEIQRHAGGYLESRKLVRLLEQIEDELVEALSLHLESEYRDIRIGDRALLAGSVVDIIATTEFYDACFEEAFDIGKIAERFRPSFVQAAQKLLITDTHAAVSIGGFVIAKYLAVLSGLPTFSVTTLKFIIRDTDEIQIGRAHV